MRLLRLVIWALAGGFFALLFLAWPRLPDVQLPAGFDAADKATIARGDYLAKAAGCKACHTAKGGSDFGGGPPLKTPFGTFYAPGIRALEGWTAEQFVRAVRHGIGPDGRPLYPVFPYASYTKMTDADAAALYAYFASLPREEAEATKHDVPLWLRWRGVLNGWRTLFLGDEQIDPAQNRGRYLAEALGHCGECHTPRTLFGAPDPKQHYAGTKDGPEGGDVPAITPAALAEWTVGDLEYFLQTGMKPNYDSVQGSMIEVIEEGTAHLSSADRAALAAYLKNGK